MQTLIAFVFAVGLLVLLHEYGHYRVARVCGVRVLRFSIGFGRPLLRWQRGDTEFVLAAIPLGGYVRMLESQHLEPGSGDAALAFDRQSLLARSAIVVAGPLANLLAAVLLFAASAWVGQPQPLPLLATPDPGSPAALAGVRAGDRVIAAGLPGAERPVPTWPDLRQQVVSARSSGETALALQLKRSDGASSQVAIDLASAVAASEPTQALGLKLQGPPAQIAALAPDGPAARAGLLPGDTIVAIDGQPVDSIESLRQLVQHSGGASMRLDAVRAATRITLQLRAQHQPASAGQPEGWRIGVQMDGHWPQQLRRLAPWPALQEGVRSTLQVSWLSLRGFASLLHGGAALQQVGGPLTIADAAGRSAENGISAYLEFLGLLSVSLGVLNLLPIPVLDGGHLLYHALEALLRRPLPRQAQQRLQIAGMACIVLLMGIALFNDFSRLIGLFH